MPVKGAVLVLLLCLALPAMGPFPFSFFLGRSSNKAVPMHISVWHSGSANLGYRCAWFWGACACARKETNHCSLPATKTCAMTMFMMTQKPLWVSRSLWEGGFWGSHTAEEEASELGFSTMALLDFCVVGGLSCALWDVEQHP